MHQELWRRACTKPSSQWLSIPEVFCKAGQPNIVAVEEGKHGVVDVPELSMHHHEKHRST